MSAGLENILICGRGLAFEMSLAALAKCLPKTITLIALDITNQPDHDAFYGNVTSPLAYDFYLSMGIDEPLLLQNTQTTFSYGTHYENWAEKFEWMQTHHLPFPVWDNIQFHHYVRRLNRSLEPYLVNAVAARAGTFVHPPRDPSVPISRAEYGYQIRPRSIAHLLKSSQPTSNVRRETGDIAHVHSDGQKVESLELTDGRRLIADLYIDATGSAGVLMSQLGNPQSADRTLGVMERNQKSDDTTPPVRKLTGKKYGWQSTTHLQGQNSVLTVYHPDDADAAKADRSGELENEFHMPIGERQKGWVGNCVGIGHINCVMEPLTQAPMMLLRLDIQRLLKLIPVSDDMSVEAHEFNRLLANDIEHCKLFHQTFYQIPQEPDTSYWRAAKSSNTPVKLERKLSQFKSRGYFTSFDFEPFNEQDWTVLHYGLNRIPERYDVFLDNLPEATVRERLDQLQSSIQQIVDKMPPHQQYLENFLNYLERKHGR